MLELNNNPLSGSISEAFYKCRVFRDLNFMIPLLVCAAPADDEFQSWLDKNRPWVRGDNCMASVSTDQAGTLPEEFQDLGNYPNPFRSSTNLRLNLPPGLPR